MPQPTAGSYASSMGFCNHIACAALGGIISLFALTGITPDISILLLFTFYQPVFYATLDQCFPSESEERDAFWVSFVEHCGDAMTHKLLVTELRQPLQVQSHLEMPGILVHLGHIQHT